MAEQSEDERPPPNPITNDKSVQSALHTLTTILYKTIDLVNVICQAHKSVKVEIKDENQNVLEKTQQTEKTRDEKADEPMEHTQLQQKIDDAKRDKSKGSIETDETEKVSVAIEEEQFEKKRQTNDGTQVEAGHTGIDILESTSSGITEPMTAQQQKIEEKIRYATLHADDLQMLHNTFENETYTRYARFVAEHKLAVRFEYMQKLQQAQSFLFPEEADNQADNSSIEQRPLSSIKIKTDLLANMIDWPAVPPELISISTSETHTKSEEKSECIVAAHPQLQLAMLRLEKLGSLVEETRHRRHVADADLKVAQEARNLVLQRIHSRRETYETAIDVIERTLVDAS